MNIMNDINDFIIKIMDMVGVFGPIIACFLIMIESMLPILPLCVFITINFIAFGPIFGFIISWFFTVIGCMLSYYIFKKGFYVKFRGYLRKNKSSLENMMVKVDNFSFGKLVVFLAIPFTPAFIVNIAAGLSDIPSKKYLLSLCIGKISLVYFWGYIGVSLIESLKNPVILIRIIFIVLIMYILAKILNKKLNL